jgi:hypothetical protein
MRFYAFSLQLLTQISFCLRSHSSTARMLALSFKREDRPAAVATTAFDCFLANAQRCGQRGLNILRFVFEELAGQ